MIKIIVRTLYIEDLNRKVIEACFVPGSVFFLGIGLRAADIFTPRILFASVSICDW